MTETAVRTDFPRQVREIENTWIPMPDGTRLAARIWLPEDAMENPVPAILEYLPYRKRDGTVERDQLTHPYFAGHGYAGVRVDMRGTGDSEGQCMGEYLPQEQEDCIAVIDWLATQPWCSGKVGMIGISWGGFNGLQLAARRPGPLAAVISLCSTDDRYTDDIHFMGGACLTEKLTWGATAFAIAHTPPDPAIVGARWREMWLERLKGNGLWLLDWFRHQRRDGFYEHGSVCQNYADIELPVYMVGGWADGYTNAVFRILDRLPATTKGLVGPWAHKYPHFARPGPMIGFLQECLRWWDQHLKGIDTGVMDEPRLRAFVQDPVPPAPYHSERPGQWIALPGWSGTGTDARSLFLGDGVLGAEKPAAFVVASPENAGHAAGEWVGYGLVPDGPLDQSLETGMTWFETEPLDADLHLLGCPILNGQVHSDVPQANLAAVLSAVSEDGRATRISYGILNLTHRDSHSEPSAMPDHAVPFRLQLKACGQRIAKGQRLRLALSTAYWPVIWPSMSKATLNLSDARIQVPVFAPDPEQQPCPFGPAEGAPPLAREPEGGDHYSRSRSIDYVTGLETYERRSDTGSVHYRDIDMVVQTVNRDLFRIHPEDPHSAAGTCYWRKSYARGDWRAELETEVSVRALAGHWQIDARLVARDGDDILVEKTWSERIVRDLV